MTTILLAGAGGHARVVYDALRKSGITEPVIVADDSPALTGSRFFDLLVTIPAIPDSFASETLLHVAIGSNAQRICVLKKGIERGAVPLTVTHPAAVIGADVVIEPACFIAAGAIVAPGTTVACGSIVNHSAVVDHDCRIGIGVHIAPCAVIGGAVDIGEQCLIGAGAVILPGVRIGSRATIGAGAVVTRDVSAATTVRGVPARVD